MDLDNSNHKYFTRSKGNVDKTHILKIAHKQSVKLDLKKFVL